MQDVGTTFQPLLAGQKFSSSGNKNKTGFFDQGSTGTNIGKDSNDEYNFQNYGDDINVMDTAFSQQVIDQNCSPNSTDLVGQFQVHTCDTVHENAMQNGFFGFIPKDPLKIYDGNTLSWNSIPDIIRAHLLIKNSATPIFLGCRIPVSSKLNWNLEQILDRLLGQAASRSIEVWLPS